MQQETGVKPIDQKFLDRGHLLGMQFNEGIVFMEISGVADNSYKPFSELSSISGQASSGWTRLEDPDNNNDILYVEKEDMKVLHAAIGASPACIRRYTNYPEDENRLRSIPNLATPAPGDDYGGINGEQSPYESPTDAQELFIPPGVHLNFNFYNASQKQRDPVLHIKMREYEVQPLDPSNGGDADAISRVVTPGSPMPIVPAGSINRQISFDLDHRWGVSPITYERARRLGGGSR